MCPGWTLFRWRARRDLNLPIADLPGAIVDYAPSEHFEKIRSIIGREEQYRRDALHVDSAFKSNCSIFVTRDSDILKHKTQLLDLLGIQFFDPKSELHELELLICPIESDSRASRSKDESSEIVP